MTEHHPDEQLRRLAQDLRNPEIFPRKEGTGKNVPVVIIAEAVIEQIANQLDDIAAEVER